MRILASVAASTLVGFARALTGVRAIWKGCAPEDVQRVYYGNHSSHGDFVLIWSSLPPPIRRRTRPVAGSDYWLQGTLRRYIATQVIDAVLIDRAGTTREQDPIAVLAQAVDDGVSLIVFPEGTRNTTDAVLLPFKSGIYRLALARPQLEFVPVWIENLNRVMPKGEVVPIPLLCTTTFGEPLRLAADEAKEAFVERTRNALLALAPQVMP
ncbi:MAG TPA: lysophospholipid acyltransferase family protein [Burkholderiales bacterium]|nr:lysophospholipid acyltransferase family protein [Burkholderiales bacterium]